jgi:hypothetical protein
MAVFGCDCSACEEENINEFLDNSNRLENHLISVLLTISRLDDTDPRAALLAQKAIEFRRLESIRESDE